MNRDESRVRWNECTRCGELFTSPVDIEYHVTGAVCADPAECSFERLSDGRWRLAVRQADDVPAWQRDPAYEAPGLGARLYTPWSLPYSEHTATGAWIPQDTKPPVTRQASTVQFGAWLGAEQ